MTFEAMVGAVSVAVAALAVFYGLLLLRRIKTLWWRRVAMLGLLVCVWGALQHLGVIAAVSQASYFTDALELIGREVLAVCSTVASRG